MNTKSKFSLLGKKRNSEIKNTSNIKTQENNYDNISNLYKNIFGFDWTDNLFKEGQKILENLKPDAVIFLYNTLYFKHDLYYLNLVNKSYLLNSFFEPFDFKTLDIINIKKSPLISDKINFIFKMFELFITFKKKELDEKMNQSLSKEDKFHKFNSYLFQKYQHIRNINRLKIANLIEKVNTWQKNQKFIDQKIKIERNNNNSINNNIINIPRSNLLKDNQLPNDITSNKILNNFCSSLHHSEMELNNKKKNCQKIFESYLEVNKLKNEEDWTCFVCNNGILEGDDFFYECEKCKISVHQYCYSISTYDSEHWLCDACSVMSEEESQNLECILCPVKGGAMKRVNLPNDCQFINNIQKLRKKELDLNKNKYNSVCIIPKENSDISKTKRAWVHLSCALWNDDIEIKDNKENKDNNDNKGNNENKEKKEIKNNKENNENIYNKENNENKDNKGKKENKKNKEKNENKEDTNINFIDNISYDKFMEKCDVCGKSGYGPTKKCKNEECNFRCHPECGRINGYRLEIERKNKIGTLMDFNIYCFLHQPVKLGKILEKDYKTEEQNIEEFANFLKRTYRNYEKEYQKNITEFIHPNKLIIDKSN